MGGPAAKEIQLKITKTGEAWGDPAIRRSSAWRADDIVVLGLVGAAAIFGQHPQRQVRLRLTLLAEARGHLI
jgi:hypothetical protein